MPLTECHFRSVSSTVKSVGRESRSPRWGEEVQSCHFSVSSSKRSKLFLLITNLSSFFRRHAEFNVLTFLHVRPDSTRPTRFDSHWPNPDLLSRQVWPHLDLPAHRGWSWWPSSHQKLVQSNATEYKLCRLHANVAAYRAELWRHDDTMRKGQDLGRNGVRPHGRFGHFQWFRVRRP